MKMAQGYVTDDGTFFESKLEAELHEAEAKLRAQLATEYPQLNTGGFFEVVQNLMSPLKEYINAFNATYTAKSNQQAEDEDGGEADKGGPPAPDASLGHVSSAEEDLASLLKLPARGLSHVPDVGSRASTAKVSKRREKHGTGGG